MEPNLIGLCQKRREFLNVKIFIFISIIKFICSKVLWDESRCTTTPGYIKITACGRTGHYIRGDENKIHDNLHSCNEKFKQWNLGPHNEPIHENNTCRYCFSGNFLFEHDQRRAVEICTGEGVTKHYNGHRIISHSLSCSSTSLVYNPFKDNVI